MKRLLKWLAVVPVFAVGAVSAADQSALVDDATLKLGARVFIICRACHSTEKDGHHKVGPNLWGVFGSKAGSKPDYKYSDAVKNSTVVWTDKTIDEWLSKPKDFLPGNKMAFVGVSKEDERKAVIAFLKKETGAQ